jgi:hypothetical protein
MGFEDIAAGVHLPFPAELSVPRLVRVELPAEEPPAVADIAGAARDAVIARFGSLVTAGQTVALGAGSRGLTGRVEMLAGTVAGFRALGLKPFVVPAMGSHGGATADGQVEVLRGYGITPAAIGCEIRATMEVEFIGRTSCGMPVYHDKEASAADWFVPVNRIKPHTCFEGPIESGIAKMAVVGFGKQAGAQALHSYGAERMGANLIEGFDLLRATGRVLGGVSTIESSSGSVVRVSALTADEIGSPHEMELLEYAEGLLPKLPFDVIDVLVVERIGKDISGVGVDPNVSGRFWVHGVADRERPRVTNIVVLGVTDVSHGNALGIGLADFTTVAVVQSIDWRNTWINCFTAGPAGVRRAKMPMALPTENDAILAAVAMCGRGATESVRMVRIESTLHMTSMLVSENLLDELPPGAQVIR